MSWFAFLADVTIREVEIDRDVELGKGSDATVCAGVWHGASVAVKILRRALVDPQGSDESRRALINKFVRECERLQRLRHPNIVQFLGVFRVNDEQPALVTELLDSTLMKRYQTHPYLSDLQATRLFKDGAAGLSYLHSRRIIHRDITTRNVLVSKEGRAKLADVGVSCQLSDHLNMTAAPGTILYMAPETLSLQSSYNEQMDVFSYGVLMLAVLLRREPAKELLYKSRSQLIDNTEQAIPEVSRRGDDLSALGYDHPLCALIVMCLQNVPEQRPPSREMLCELSAIIDRFQGKDRDTEVDRLSDSPFEQDYAVMNFSPPVKARRLTRGMSEGDMHDLVKQREQLVKDRAVLCSQFSQVPAKLSQIAVGPTLASGRFEHVRPLCRSSAEGREIAAAVRFCSALHMYQSQASSKKKVQALPFAPKWSSASRPVSESCSRLLTATHDGHLYVVGRVEDHSSSMLRTKDLVEWHPVIMKTQLYCITAIGHHKDRLFCLASEPSANLDQRFIYWLSMQDDICLPVMARNGGCPHEYFCDSAVSVGDSIVLFGGYNGVDTFPVVAEYSVNEARWMDGSWPDLPRPLAGAIPILFQDELHLFGGTELHSSSSGEFNSSVLTMRLADFKPSSVWLKDVIPSTPHCSSGAVQVFHHCIVAGGHDVNGKAYYTNCYALDVVSRKWLKLPSLKSPRCSMELVLFNDSLIAMGGFSLDSKGHKHELLLHTDVEVLKVDCNTRQVKH